MILITISIQKIKTKLKYKLDIIEIDCFSFYMITLFRTKYYAFINLSNTSTDFTSLFPASFALINATV